MWLLLWIVQSYLEFSISAQKIGKDSEVSKLYRCQLAHSPHFVLFFTVWKRLSLAQLVIQHHARLQRHFPGTISLWLVGSQGKLSSQLANNNLSRVYYTECPNYPISDKHNCGLQRLGQSNLASNIDGIIIIGSDDLCEHSLFELYRLYYCTRFPRIHFMGLQDYLLLDMKTMKVQRLYFCENNPISSYFGVGRFLSKSLLEAMNWTIWESGLNQGLDQSMIRKLWYHFPFMDRISLAISPKEHDLVVLDIKSEASGLQDATNIWSFEEMMEKTSSKNNLSYCTEPVKDEPNKLFYRFYSSFHASLDQVLLSLRKVVAHNEEL